MIKYYNINGQITPKESAVVHVSDLGLQRGYGIFDYFKVEQKVPVFFEDYMNRWEKSAAYMHLELPLSRRALKAQIQALIEANKVEKCAIKLILTGGFSPDGYTPSEPNLYILMMEQYRHADVEIRDGLKLMSLDYQRELPHVKTTNYAMSLIAQNQLRAIGAKDYLYYKDGFISESSRANFFIVQQDDTIVTNEKNILKGITRKQMIRLARSRYNLEIRDITFEEVLQAKEAFLTSSAKGALGVVQIDDKVIGNGKVGKVTQTMDRLYSEALQQYVLDNQVVAV